MKSMKKTLVICGEYPLPENSGTRMRTMNFVRYFKSLGEVDIAYSTQLLGGEMGKQIFSNKYILEKVSPKKNYKFHLLKRLSIGVPLPINEFKKESKQLLNKLIRENKYDYILVRYVRNASIFLEKTNNGNKKIIIDFDDVLSESLYENKYGPFNTLLRKIVFGINRKQLIRFEKKCLQFDASLFCSNEDEGKYTTKKKGERTFVVPNVCEVSWASTINSEYDNNKTNNLLFVGSLNYEPNVDGLEWFIEKVFPDFVKSYPDAKLTIVGHSPTKNLENLCNSDEKLDLIGPVPDLNKYYMQCNAVIVPLNVGGGTRIKILEAAMVNRPVLSTPKGAEGLELIDGESILLFSNASEFCSKYSQLKSGNKYALVTENAKQFVQNNYSINSFNKIMDQVLMSLDY